MSGTQVLTQVLMAVSDFWVFFLGIILLKGALFFNGRVKGVILSEEYPPMGGGVGWGVSALMGWGWKKSWDVGAPAMPPPPPLWETLDINNPCVPDLVKDMNIKVLNLMSRTNETSCDVAWDLCM